LFGDDQMEVKVVENNEFEAIPFEEIFEESVGDGKILHSLSGSGDLGSNGAGYMETAQAEW